MEGLSLSSRLGVYEEFEVDPDQNEGENYQFHDVKRQKAERRLMHGGDCECCKDVSSAGRSGLVFSDA